MELSSNEIRAFKGVKRRQQMNIIGRWLGLATGFAVFGVDVSTQWFPSLDVSVGHVALMFSVFLFVSNWSPPTPNEKLIGLLQRYVNNDAEALKQINDQVLHDQHAA